MTDYNADLLASKCDRLDAIYDQLEALADRLNSDLTGRLHRRVTKADAQASINRVIGARQLLVLDDGAEDKPQWEASSRALDRAKLYGFSW